MNPTEFRRIRKSLGLTQEGLARRLDITVRQMHAIENGEAIPMRYQFALRWIEYSMSVDREAERA